MMDRRGFVACLGAGFACATLGRWPGRPGLRSALAGGMVPVERWSWAMGQPVRLICYAASEAAGLEAAQAAFAVFREVDTRLTRFDPSGDLAELHHHAGRRFIRPHPVLGEALRRAGSFRARTAGDFDAAIAPLLAAWGFYDPRDTLPGAAELREASEAVRAARIEWQGARVRLATSEARLDFGGLGVGIGLDRAAAMLRSRGIRRAMLDMSGDLLLMGAPPGEAGWLVEIADSARPGRFIRQLRIRDAAVATSANSVEVVRYDRLVRGHVMGRDGSPAVLGQVTVVSDTATEADALSTAMLVRGRAWPGVRTSVVLDNPARIEPRKTRNSRNSQTRAP